MHQVRERLESRQIVIYFCTVAAAAIAAWFAPGLTALEVAVNPPLALMLFVTFLQVPVVELGRAFGRVRFLAALLVANFIAVPILVAILVQFLPADRIVRLGVLLVLLTPCIDYVVTFSHLGRADSRLLPAATPALLIAQMVLLPGCLGLFLGKDAAGLVHLGPFVHAFVWLIAAPLLLAVLAQIVAAKSKAASHFVMSRSPALGAGCRPSTKAFPQSTVHPGEQRKLRSHRPVRVLMGYHPAALTR